MFWTQGRCSQRELGCSQTCADVFRHGCWSFRLICAVIYGKQSPISTNIVGFLVVTCDMYHTYVHMESAPLLCEYTHVRVLCFLYSWNCNCVVAYVCTSACYKGSRYTMSTCKLPLQGKNVPRVVSLVGGILSFIPRTMKHTYHVYTLTWNQSWLKTSWLELEKQSLQWPIASGDSHFMKPILMY